MAAPSRRPDWPRLLAPAAILVGLVVFGTSLVALGVLAGEDASIPLRHAQASQVNETAVVAYAVPFPFYEDGRLQGTFAFPDRTGDVLVLTCPDYARLLAGEAPREPILARRSVEQGSLSVSPGELPHRAIRIGIVVSPNPPGEPALPPPRAPCIDLLVAFAWTGNATADEWPAVDLTLHREPLDEPVGAALVALSVLGIALTLGGGVAWRRQRAEPAVEPDEGTAETLLRLSEQGGAWLERTRRYLVLAGVLGVLLWYPVLVPLAWGVGRRGSDLPWMPWLLAGLALVLLGGLTALWLRELGRLDRELGAWRQRLARLRQREEDLLASLEGTP